MEAVFESLNADLSGSKQQIDMSRIDGYHRDADFRLGILKPDARGRKIEKF